MFERFARGGGLAALVAGLCLIASVPAAAQSTPAAAPGPVTLQGAAFGQDVVLTWTASAGATTYDIAVGLSANNYQLIQNVGFRTTLTIQAPPGVYYARVAGRNAEGYGAPSNEIAVVVTPTAGLPPAAPTGLTAQVGGQNVALSWQLGQGGGPASGLVFAVGSRAGENDIGVIPLHVSTSTATSVASGTYFARLYAVGPGGISAPSNEITVVVGQPGCQTPVGPTLSANVSGTNVGLSWNAVAGVAGYRLDVSMTPGGPLVLAHGVAPNTTTLSVSQIGPGTYYAKVTALSACGTEATGPEIPVVVERVAGGRTPDPPPGQRLPLPNVYEIVAQTARDYPADFRNSCVDHGGNNVWLFRLVQRLRQIDTRWGLNWKRGDRGSMSQDVIDYHWGAGPDEDSRDTYVVDIIVGHCGSPSPGWLDVTGHNGADARWTLIPYSRAGLQP